jgi:hypothetical protein
VAPAGKVISQLNITRVKNPLGAIAQTNFHLPLQGNYVLSPRGNMKVMEITGRGLAELYPAGLLHRSALSVGHFLIGKLQLLKVGLAIITSINSDYLH